MFDKYLVQALPASLVGLLRRSWYAARRRCMRLCCMMTPIPICSRRRYAPSLVMCAIKAHCQTSSRMPTAVPV